MLPEQTTYEISKHRLSGSTSPLRLGTETNAQRTQCTNLLFTSGSRSSRSDAGLPDYARDRHRRQTTAGYAVAGQVQKDGTVPVEFGWVSGQKEKYP